MSMMNGHSSEMDGDDLRPSSRLNLSESDLSEVHDLHTTSHSPNTELEDQLHSDDDAMRRMETSELEEDDDDADAPGEADADFSEDSPPHHPTSGALYDASSADESPRPSKRKAEIDEEEYMKQNPELYGLRRSGRARPARRVVDSSDEDEDEDEVNSGRRRKRQKITGTRPASTKDLESAPQSESEDDVYGGQRGRTFAKKHRQRLQAVASGRDSPNLSAVRFSERKAARVTTNYNEDDGLSEDETEDMTPNYTYVEEDTRPAIDVPVNHRLKEGADLATATKFDFEYFIKWQGQAHYHATWEEWQNLTGCRGFRRLENYFRKITKADISIATDPDLPLEDKERYNLDREAYLDSINDYMKVERVIGVRDGDEEKEYYVKWRGLFYESCTWETASLVSELAQTEIDRYLNHSSKLPTSNATESRLATRSAYRKFTTQPAYIKGGTLRDFQIHGLNFLCYNWCGGNNVILADEMGLGKTVQTVSFMNWLRHDRQQQGPFLVVVPLSTMPAWADTFDKWTPDMNYVVYNGNEASRNIIRDYELLVDGNPAKVKFHVLLTTYEYILSDAAFLSRIKWQFLAVDEAHRLKNRDSQLYAKLMEFAAPSRLLITGTPIQNTLSELSALMNFLMPGRVKVDENIDLSEEHASEKITQLTKDIAPFMIRRTKQKVESDLPPKTEKIIRVELSDVQLEYYQNILTRNYAALNAGAKAGKTSLLNIIMELKKASNHPFMFPNVEHRILKGNDSREEQLKAIVTTSGKMMLLDRLLTKLKRDGHRVLIFSQMVKLLDIVGDYLQLRGYQFQRLDGTIAAGPRRMAIDHFNAPDSQDFCFLLSTRAGGLGINLMTADTVILFDSDWNPQADLQAMARAHRIGQQKPVSIYRLVSKDTIEEEVLERARNKLMLEFVTIQRGVTDKDAQDLTNRIAKAGANSAEPTSSDDISRILKRRGQKMFEQSGNQKKLEELDIDAVLENAEENQTAEPEGITTDGGEEFLKNFEYTDVKLDLEWDDIIPKDQLDKIKEEERKRKEAEYLESVIEQNQPRKRKAPGDDNGEKGRAAKKRARDSVAAAAVDDGDSDVDNDSDAGQDPKRPLSVKECRNLVRAFERYGAIEDMEEPVIKEARLVGRDLTVVKATLQEILDMAQAQLKEHEDQLVEAQKSAAKPVTKKDKKAVLFDFNGVKRLNAETLMERPTEMRMLRNVVANCGDWRSFRVPEASKPASYTCEWGAREDGMLCVGIARHGYGAWAQIRDDTELNMVDKLFLEEHRVDKKEERSKAEGKEAAKSPGAVHLVRRANYLLSVLKDKTSNGTNLVAKKALENHHRNNRKHMGQYHGRIGTPTGERSSTPRKHHGTDKAGETRHSVDRLSRGAENGHRKSSFHDSERSKQRLSDERKPAHHRTSSSQTNGYPQGPAKNEAESKIRDLLDPIVTAMSRVSGATKKHIPDDDNRLKMIKQCLVNIGNQINKLVREGHGKLEDSMWAYVTDYYWPQSKATEKRVSGHKLRDMFKKIAGKDMAAAKTSPPKSKADSKPVVNGIAASRSGEKSKGQAADRATLSGAKRSGQEKSPQGTTNATQSAGAKRKSTDEALPTAKYLKTGLNSSAQAVDMKRTASSSSTENAPRQLPSFQKASSFTSSKDVDMKRSASISSNEQPIKKRPGSSSSIDNAPRQLPNFQRASSFTGSKAVDMKRSASNSSNEQIANAKRKSPAEATQAPSMKRTYSNASAQGGVDMKRSASNSSNGQVVGGVRHINAKDLPKGAGFFSRFPRKSSDASDQASNVSNAKRTPSDASEQSVSTKRKSLEPHDGGNGPAKKAKIGEQ